MFIFLCLIVCLFVGAFQVVAGQAINPIVYTVISTGMAYSLMLLGVHTGIAMPQEPMNNPASSESFHKAPVSLDSSAE